MGWTGLSRWLTHRQRRKAHRPDRSRPVCLSCRVLKHFLAYFCVWNSPGEKIYLGNMWVLEGKMEVLYKILGIVTGLEGKYKVGYNIKKLGVGLECRRPRRTDWLCFCQSTQIYWTPTIYRCPADARIMWTKYTQALLICNLELL